MIGGDRCDREAMRRRLALARGGPLLAMVDHRALAELALPDDVHLVVVDPPVLQSDVAAVCHAAAGRAVHLAWGADEAAHALRIAEDDLAVRDTARALWPLLRDAAGPLPWDDRTAALLAGDGPVARSPRAVAVALAAMRDAGLLTTGEPGVEAREPSGTTDLDATPTGLHAAALRQQAREMAGRAMTVDLFADPSLLAGALP